MRYDRQVPLTVTLGLLDRMRVCMEENRSSDDMGKAHCMLYDVKSSC